MDSVYQIFDYLPIRYQIDSDFDYFEFLKNSVEQNYHIENYHFASIALHMVFMGIVYHHLYILTCESGGRRDALLRDSKKIRNQYNKRGKVLSWQNFSSENERSVFKFLKTVGAKNDMIDQLKQLVDQRNDLVHTNGSLLQDQVLFDEKANDYLQGIKNIHYVCREEYKNLFLKFLNELQFDIEDIQDAEMYLENFIRKYAVSRNLLSHLGDIVPKSRYLQGTQLLYSIIQDRGL
ncbi:MAG: hypothetical protein F4X82_01010 [Candidatus Spechtbacteria bacterium SB0662_bin_43]|uniref:Uncharacterized protein n=1 Tax=Candidatus Spechtbacteria bacterium SB0662_bin_43 TaxID=2604897 RepID=A0A845D9M2_9BACT|nr:hypothetical protein [Candidatus Spechtbacteria bacterium SB0662_bin_43]